MKKSFINKQSGIKLNVIGSVVLALLGVFVAIGLFNAQPVQAANQGYTEVFQNQTTTLSGQSVQTNVQFTKENYWQLKKVRLTLNYQISQLADRQSSDMTLALNGVKFNSFRPNKSTGLQTKQVDVPIKLLQGTNQLTVSGQVLTKVGNHYQTEPTPANWLTLYTGSSVNFAFKRAEADKSIKSFYAHLTGMDTVSAGQSVIGVPKSASDSELTAATTALTGLARLITTSNSKLPITTTDDVTFKDANYRIVMATYNQLTADQKKQVPEQEVVNGAVLKTDYHDGKHDLIVTARTTSELIKAARFVANSELMEQTTGQREQITPDTATATSILQYEGLRQLTTVPTNLTGSGHQSATYFITLPTDSTNADGSTIHLHLRYAKNLDFKRSLVTVRVNDVNIGSHRLSAKRADGDAVNLTLPRGQSLGNVFTITVGFDLAMPGSNQNDNSQTPWAEVEPSSQADIKSRTRKDLLFTNFPTVFVKNDAYDKLLLVRPRTMTSDDYASLTNLVTLFGAYVKRNTGSVKVSHQVPSKSQLTQSNVVAFGSPRENKLISNLNNKLFFRYHKDKSGFIGNEKLSIERHFGETVGTVQLLRSPYNQRHGLLVVTGPTAEMTRLGADAISSQAAIGQYQGDTVVVDTDGNHYSYRFKKKTATKRKENVGTAIAKNKNLVAYLAMASFAVIIIILMIVLTLRKHHALTTTDSEGDNKDE